MIVEENGKPPEPKKAVAGVLVLLHADGTVMTSPIQGETVERVASVIEYRGMLTALLAELDATVTAQRTAQAVWSVLAQTQKQAQDRNIIGRVARKLGRG